MKCFIAESCGLITVTESYDIHRVSPLLTLMIHSVSIFWYCWIIWILLIIIIDKVHVVLHENYCPALDFLALDSFPVFSILAIVRNNLLPISLTNVSGGTFKCLRIFIRILSGFVFWFLHIQDYIWYTIYILCTLFLFSFE